MRDLGVLRERLDALYDSYRQSRTEDRRYVLNRYRTMTPPARSWASARSEPAPGVDSHRTVDDPLMLQMKEANESVFERFDGRSPYATHGERVVQGQKSDPIHR